MTVKTKFGHELMAKFWHEVWPFFTREKSVLRILIWQVKVPFFWSQKWAILSSDRYRTTKNGTLSGHIEILRPLFSFKHSPNIIPMTFNSWIYHLWARFWPFQFCWFLGFFWPFSPDKIGSTLGQNLLISSWPNFLFKVMGQFYT